MKKLIITLAALTTLAACDARTIDPGTACYEDGDTDDGYAATGMPSDDLMPLPEPGPQPRPPMVPAPAACDPDAWARVHAFAAIEYYTVMECPLVHEDQAYYQHEFDLITEAAERCGVTSDQLDANELRALNTLGFICSNRVPQGN